MLCTVVTRWFLFGDAGGTTTATGQSRRVLAEIESHSVDRRRCCGNRSRLLPIAF